MTSLVHHSVTFDQHVDDAVRLQIAGYPPVPYAPTRRELGGYRRRRFLRRVRPAAIALTYLVMVALAVVGLWAFILILTATPIGY
jgi:hypothetical protein